MTTVTPWFDPKVDGQPVRVGKYQRKYVVPIMDYWDGEYWRYRFRYGRHAVFQDLPWRGLTSPDGK